MEFYIAVFIIQVNLIPLDGLYNDGYLCIIMGYFDYFVHYTMGMGFLGSSDD